MEHVSCPMCGKSTAWENFDPDNLELDIQMLTFKGPRRGRGFQVVARRSTIADDDDEIIEPIKNKVLRLVFFFHEKGKLTEEDISEFIRPIIESENED